MPTENRSTDPRDLFISLNPLGLADEDLRKDTTGFADQRTHSDYLTFLAGFNAAPPADQQPKGLFSDEDRYLLCREELRECEDERSALSDEARELRDHVGKLEGLLAEALLAIEGGCHAVSLPERINAALTCNDEQDPPSGYFFDTGPYQVELGEEQWLKALSVFDNYTQGNQDTFVCAGDNLRGLVSEMLIELGLAPAVD